MEQCRHTSNIRRHLLLLTGFPFYFLSTITREKGGGGHTFLISLIIKLIPSSPFHLWRMQEWRREMNVPCYMRENAKRAKSVAFFVSRNYWTKNYATVDSSTKKFVLFAIHTFGKGREACHNFPCFESSFSVISTPFLLSYAKRKEKQKKASQCVIPVAAFPYIFFIEYFLWTEKMRNEWSHSPGVEGHQLSIPLLILRRWWEMKPEERSSTWETRGSSRFDKLKIAFFIFTGITRKMPRKNNYKLRNN